MRFLLVTLCVAVVFTPTFGAPIRGLFDSFLGSVIDDIVNPIRDSFETVVNDFGYLFGNLENLYGDNFDFDGETDYANMTDDGHHTVNYDTEDVPASTTVTTASVTDSADETSISTVVATTTSTTDINDASTSTTIAATTSSTTANNVSTSTTVATNNVTIGTDDAVSSTTQSNADGKDNTNTTVEPSTTQTSS